MWAIIIDVGGEEEAKDALNKNGRYGIIYKKLVQPKWMKDILEIEVVDWWWRFICDQRRSREKTTRTARWEWENIHLLEAINEHY